MRQEFNAIAKVKQQQQQQRDQLSGLTASGSNPLLQQLLQKRSRGADGRDGDAEEDGDLDGEEQPDAANTFLVRSSRRMSPAVSLCVGFGNWQFLLGCVNSSVFKRDSLLLRPICMRYYGG